ncbi:MAG: ATP-binding cassette domain-containing protein [Verrucomicrobiales bacterium]|nr:ATP-binding cassette domain-containing protein [Verrucomicrobiales bacterium]
MVEHVHIEFALMGEASKREIARTEVANDGIDRVRTEAEVELCVKRMTKKERLIRTYSKGMQQRVGLAQALINNPDLLILDEPTSGLDPIGRMKVREIIQRLKNEGKTVFFSSHELGEVETVCDRLAILFDGELKAAGSVPSLLAPGETNLEQAFLRIIGFNLNSNPIPTCAPSSLLLAS